MKHYVLGFYLTPHGVVLIEKTKPDWQRGLCNGLGGSVEPSERGVEAMVREFREESGIETAADDWQYVATMRNPDKWTLRVLKASGNGIPADFTYTCDEGTVKVYPELPPNMEPTARWLYLMCADTRVSGCEIGGQL